MFSLPNIQALSVSAAKAREHVRKSKTLKCDSCGERFPKAAEGRFVEETFGPFNTKPEGLIVLCPACAEKNREHFGEDFSTESYFRCADCGQVHVTNYSWEIYKVVIDGEELCRHCAGKRAASDKNPDWIASAEKAEEVLRSIANLQDYSPKHLTIIGGHDLPGGLMSFRDTPEFEAEGLDWFSRFECGGFGQGAGGLLEQLRESLATVLKHYTKAMIVVGEAGQFQTYLDIVVKSGDARAK